MTANMPQVVDELSERERQLKSRLEMDIKANLEGFKKVGYALATIRDQRLYRIDYDSFEEYCRQEWDLGRPRAYQLMASAEVMVNLSTIVDKADESAFEILPCNEAQTRPLALLSAENQRKAWAMVLERSAAEDIRITAMLVMSCVNDLLQKNVTQKIQTVRKESKARHSCIPEPIQLSFEAFITNVERETDAKWQQNGRREMARLLRELLTSLEDY